MSKNNNFQFFLLFPIEMIVFSVFWQKKAFGPLGVKDKGIVQISKIVKMYYKMKLRIILKLLVSNNIYKI